VAIETSETWGKQAIDLVKNIGRRIAEVMHEPGLTAFLRQRISIVIIINIIIIINFIISNLRLRTDIIKKIEINDLDILDTSQGWIRTAFHLLLCMDALTEHDTWEDLEKGGSTP